MKFGVANCLKTNDKKNDNFLVIEFYACFYGKLIQTVIRIITYLRDNADDRISIEKLKFRPFELIIGEEE